MPRNGQPNENQFLRFVRRLKTKAKYIFTHQSVDELYLLYFEGEFLRIIDEDFFTLLRIPEAIDTGDSINHYDYNSVNHWISAHPKFVIPFLVCSATVGIARVIQAIASTPDYPETVSEFLALIRKDANEEIPEANLNDDVKLLNGFCNELGIPYFYVKHKVIKRKITKIDNRPFFARLFSKPNIHNKEEYRELIEEQEPHEELILYKKDEPQKPLAEQSPDKPKENWFERTYRKIENSKFVEYVLTPPWKAATRAAYAYWILWFGAVIVSAIITGTLVLTATGTVAVTTAALAVVIGIPAAIGLAFWGHDIFRIFWPKKTPTPDIESTEMDKHKPAKIVEKRAERENVLSMIGKALALQMHTNQQKTILDENHKKLIKKVENNESDLQVVGSPAPSSTQSSTSSLSDLGQNQTQENKEFSTAKGRITWQSFFNFCTGYVYATFGVWFLTSAVTAVALKFGAVAVAGALSGTVIGIPLSLLIMFSVGVSVGGMFAMSTVANQSVAQKEKEAFLIDHPELRPEIITQREQELKSVKLRLKTLQQQHHELVAQYNSFSKNDSSDKSKELSPATPKKEIEELPIQSKLNYRTMKNTNIAYTNTNQSTFGKICDYALTAVGNAGRMGYITRSLLIGGMITVLVVSCLNPLGFLTGPIAIAVAVGVSALLFGAATVTDRYFQAQRDREELDNLRLRLFEVKEKEKLKNHLVKQCDLIETQNNNLEGQIAVKKKQHDEEIALKKQKIQEDAIKAAAEKKARETENSTSIVTQLKNFLLNSNADKVAPSETCRAQAVERKSLLDPAATPVY